MFKNANVFPKVANLPPSAARSKTTIPVNYGFLSAKDSQMRNPGFGTHGTRSTPLHAQESFLFYIG